MFYPARLNKARGQEKSWVHSQVNTGGADGMGEEGRWVLVVGVVLVVAALWRWMPKGLRELLAPGDGDDVKPEP